MRGWRIQPFRTRIRNCPRGLFPDENYINPSGDTGMRLTSSSFNHNEVIPAANAFCVPDAEKHVSLGGNKNPALEWDGVPDGTKSLVLVCVDPDVPTVPETVNQENSTIPVDQPRCDFYHWVLVDIPGEAIGMQEGEFSEGITSGGKDGPAASRGMRQGVNDYTNWFADDKEMTGAYFGYDGPCPPWNDQRLHHYHFTLYALSLERCPVGDDFTAAEVLAAIEGHILGQARLTGLYSLNPDVGTENTGG